MATLLEEIHSRIYIDPRQLRTHLDEHHSGDVIVFTNGCFDLLHRGHITYLSRARELGGVLVMGINSDASVQKLKGPTRPVTSEMDRAFALAALRAVDYVTIFSEDTPEALLSVIRPHIHTKGGDYRPEDLPEKGVVEAHGGRVEIIPFVDGYSTTKTIQKMNG